MSSSPSPFASPDPFAPPATGARRIAPPGGRQPATPWTVADALRFGWDFATSDYVRRPLPIAAIGLLSLVLNGVSGKVLALAFGRSWPDPTFHAPSFWIGQTIALALGTLVTCTATAAALAGARGEPSSVAAFTRYLHRAPAILAATLLSYLVVGAGLLLLVVPGMIAAMGVMFAPAILLDTDLGPWTGVKRSLALTRGYRWRWLLVGVVLGLAMFALTILTLGIGMLLLGIPMLAGVYAFVFLKLSDEEPAPLG